MAVRKGDRMLPWLIAGILAVGALAWKILHNAQKDDRRRKLPKGRQGRSGS
ncbi:MAG TPA: hypothetical protein VMT00_15370 [Thermoanaerobaculia bacterium]|nr:hypothetical protein [Thermoanaerobaculia bacterium]